MPLLHFRIHNSKFRILPFFTLLLLAAATAAHADVTLASPFTDHAVLQQGDNTPVWGTATPGETITLSFNGQTLSATADKDGKWMVRLHDLKADATPHDLTIAGANTLTLHDLLVGEVWLCSGQSNMDFTLAKTPKYYYAGAANEDAEVAAADYPTIRMFSGHWSRQYEPQSRVDGEWKVCTPQNAREFSAIGYFFARDLQKALRVPVGIVTQTYGASTAESWVSREALVLVPELKPWIDAFDAQANAFTTDQRKAHDEAQRQWEKDIATVTDTAKRIKEPATKDPANNQHNPTVLFNGMLNPIIPYRIRGVLWYQGESIAHDLNTYPLVMETLVKDWRARWNDPALPFYFCQLASLNNKSNRPEVREAQAQLLTLPDTAMAVTIDIGDPKNVHPKNKQDVGDRLSRIALAKTYGQPVEYAGPTYESMKIEGNAIRLAFGHTDKGLVAKGADTGELKTFTIAGADGKFLPATAKIDGNTVLVSSPDVPAPTAVRYAWANNPEGCNLYNTANLPAPPFRTDKP